MYKNTPHCKLEKIQALINEGRVLMTKTAIEGVKGLGLNAKEMLVIIRGLTPSDFYKSMTTYADNTVWQDVYRPKTFVGDLYLKFTVEDNVLIVSFKRL